MCQVGRIRSGKQGDREHNQARGGPREVDPIVLQSGGRAEDGWGSADKRYEEGKLRLANRRAEKPTERSDFLGLQRTMAERAQCVLTLRDS